MENNHEIVLYQSEGVNVCVNVVFFDDTFWLTQRSMAELFEVNIPAVNKHLANIYEEGELQKGATISKMETVQIEGSREIKRIINFYNLDAQITAPTRVKFSQA